MRLLFAGTGIVVGGNTDEHRRAWTGMERMTGLDRIALANVSARVLGMLVVFSACSSEPAATTSTGGAPSGGTVATGGVTSGGTVATGGTSSTPTGGVVSTGGTVATGGTVTSGGTTASGGSTATGGATTSGGATASGGTSAGGGSSGMGGSLGTGGSSAGASTGGASSGGAGGANGGTGGATGAFTLTSPSHAEGAKFASKFTCADAGFDKSIMPELKWTAGPAGTKSYAITFIDTSLAPANMNGYHWVAYNIPPSTLGLPESFRDATTVNAKQSGAFLGPCPNFMSSGALKTDNYEFTLYALATDTVTFTGSGTAMVKDAETKLGASNLAVVKLKGTSDAKWPK